MVAAVGCEMFFYKGQWSLHVDYSLFHCCLLLIRGGTKCIDYCVRVTLCSAVVALGEAICFSASLQSSSLPTISTIAT